MELSYITQKLEIIFKTYIVPLLQINENQFEVAPIDKKAPVGAVCFNAFINESIKFKIITQYFDKQVGKIVKSIWKQLFSIFVYIVNSNKGFSKRKKYEDALFESAYVWGIAQWLGGGFNNIDITVYKILRQFISWSMKTYENAKVKFGVVIDAGDPPKEEKRDNKTETKPTNVNFVKFLELDAAASISDGSDTYFIVSNKGNIIRVSDDELSVDKGKEVFAPLEFRKICQASVNHNVGISLSESGDIYCFKRQQLRIARLNGKWVVFSYESFYEALKNRNIQESMINEIYNTCLDVSFSRTGGCLAICNHSNKLDSILPKIEDLKKKFPLLSDVYGKSFFLLPRSVRKEFMGIDGATIVDNTGHVICIGAIINSVKPGIDGGGRKAATERLSDFGLAIKISADGYIQALKDGKIVKEFK